MLRSEEGSCPVEVCCVVWGVNLGVAVNVTENIERIDKATKMEAVGA